jgi:hypothetical protein
LDRVLVIGMNPSKIPAIDLRYNRFQRTLILWLNYTWTFNYSFVNVHHTPGDFSPTEGDLLFLKKTIEYHLELNQEGARVMVMGKLASNVVRRLVPDLTFFESPHPSGLNRKLNDKKYVKCFLEQLDNYINSA